MSIPWRKSSFSGGNGGNCVEVWRKSSFSSGNNGECVEVWRKSSRSSGNGGECVELAPGAIRDSKNPDGPVLRTVDLGALISAIKRGALG
ncbi:DUF397 domain-containing protein [Actinokineospora terrae]|uniref:DUF397 domain-containing protein n=1 Tax=Actinokineospora terrae TaxID=155974 RepID=A0A1H9KCP1_9PSEU|nr:DUF397 domain-containing protein [Actinokineospora terrae]SEQ96707.1 protein of unknown function [Actinokineospora terrae]